MFQFSLDINTWRKKLGYFPQSLFQKKHQHEKYVLLNGKGGNFCVDYTEEDPINCRSYAWSANVGHYISIKGSKLKLFRWDKFSATDELEVSRVVNDIESFNDYIAKQRVDTTKDSINLSLSLYRQIRASLRDKKGEESLNALLCVFASYEDNASLTNINKMKWGLSDKAISSAKELNRTIWNQIMDQIDEGIPSLKIKPKIEILLRHAAGQIFQEAHFESVFPSQLQFPEFMPSAIKGHKFSPTFSSHYTPTSIVRSIVEEVLRGFELKEKHQITILDPAVGSGEFLKEILRQLNLTGYSGKIKLIGWDISQAAIDLANFSICFEKQAAINPSRITVELFKKNALTKSDSWDVSSDIILMNPPFISWENMGESEKEAVIEILQDNFKGRPNMAGAFLWKAANSLNYGGRIGCIVPSSILEADSFIKLRNELSVRMHIDFLGKLGDHSVFEEAISAPSILISTSLNTDKPIQLMWSDNSPDGYASGLRELRKITSILSAPQPFILPGNNFSFYYIPQLNNKNWTPIDFAAYQLIEKLNGMPKVKDLFEIKQGVRTGLNKAFIIDKIFYESLLKREQKYFRPVITNDSIHFGSLNDNAYIFYAEGKNAIKNENELKSAVPTFYSIKFSEYVDRLSTRARKSILNYWRLSEHRNWQLDSSPKIVSKEFGLAGSFAFDVEGIFVAERSHAWLSKELAQSINIGHAYIAVLSMNIVNDLLKGVSKQIMSGSYYLSSKFINDMPLPNLFDNSINPKVKGELIDIGKLLSLGDYGNDVRGRLEKLTDKVFYG
ncbi:MAG: N-6 DNA methylase [Chitinophagaceae bacterium]|nr:N-6 DNA methylase [Chitinophagaceae bacterium]